jgi:hypothetical protein
MMRYLQFLVEMSMMVMMTMESALTTNTSPALSPEAKAGEAHHDTFPTMFHLRHLHGMDP